MIFIMLIINSHVNTLLEFVSKLFQLIFTLLINDLHVNTLVDVVYIGFGAYVSDC